MYLVYTKYKYSKLSCPFKYREKNYKPDVAPRS